jgi:RNA polymerase sigma factor (sigma-70 family)
LNTARRDHLASPAIPARDDRDELVRLNDARFEPLIRAGRDEAEHEIERLIVDVAQPLIAAISRRYTRSLQSMGPYDAEDVAAAIHLRLIAKLRAVPLFADDAVRDFDRYVATITYNVINDHLRRTYPERARLKNRLRYVLTHDRRLALWFSERGMACGLREWIQSATVLPEVALDPSRILRRFPDAGRPGDALAAILAEIGGAVDFDALVSFVATVWNVGEARPADATLRAVPPDYAGTSEQLERREYLGALWAEIRELRPMQRKALLLNLRSAESDDVASLLVLTGVARIEELAATLEMAPGQLAILWNELPLDDLRIAAMLGVTRQQVINLRKSARERLARRMSRS